MHRKPCYDDDFGRSWLQLFANEMLLLKLKGLLYILTRNRMLR